MFLIGESNMDQPIRPQPRVDRAEHLPANNLNFMKPVKIIPALFSIPLLLSLFGCDEEKVTTAQQHRLADPAASPETRALFANLKQLRDQQILFGHQDTMAYGIEWENQPGRSDVKLVTGSYPAVYGWDLGGLETGQAENLDGVAFAKMRDWIIEGYRRGGVVTISWHMNNPVTGGQFNDTTPAVAKIIPGGVKHAEFKTWLDRFTRFIRSLEVNGENQPGHLIPIIFRPFHEHNGDWFWWGSRDTEEADFIDLWRFTVEYLRDQKKLDNLLYAYSPDRSRLDIDNFQPDYLYGYPGDDYVDIIGLDNYWDVGHKDNPTALTEQLAKFKRSLQYTVEIANRKNKIPALTETGLEGLTNPNWWTEVLLEGLLDNRQTRQIAYLLVWRNAPQRQNLPGHYYTPKPGRAEAADFIKFRDHPMIMFEDDLPSLYRPPPGSVRTTRFTR